MCMGRGSTALVARYFKNEDANASEKVLQRMIYILVLICTI